MDIVPFEFKHLADIDPPVMDAEQLERFTREYVIPGTAFSGVEAGRVLGCAGIVIRGSAGVAWAVLSDSLRKRPMVLHRAVKRGMRKIIEENGLKRLEASCIEGFESAARWLERLGFESNGVECRRKEKYERFDYVLGTSLDSYHHRRENLL